MANQLGQGGVFVAADATFGFGIQGDAATVTIELLAGVPAFVRARGSLVIDITNAFLYINTDGAGAWIKVGLQA